MKKILAFTVVASLYLCGGIIFATEDGSTNTSSNPEVIAAPTSADDSSTTWNPAHPNEGPNYGIEGINYPAAANGENYGNEGHNYPASTAPAATNEGENYGNEGNRVSNNEGGNSSAGAPSCADALTTAQSSCNSTNQSGMANVAMASASMAGASSGNAAAQMKAKAAIMASQAAFLTAQAYSCHSDASTCQTACVGSTSQLNQCNALNSKGDMMAMQAAQDLIAAGADESAAKAYSNANPLTPAVLAQNCTNPTFAASNVLACYCQSNPGDVAKCPNGAAGAASGGASPALAGVANKGSNELPSQGGGSDGTTSQTPQQQAAAAAPMGGYAGGGGMGAPTGAATAAAPEDSGAGAGSANGGNIFGGFSAGQGGFSYGKGAGGESQNGIAAAAKALASKFNLKGLLPKRNDYINRSVAGMSVSAQDGITGPNGPSIWEKVSRRYQIKKSELLPP